ncbi:MAG: ATP phosphoribosyltransferase [Muribaculaceae bacterium]|nr:ATP phosphoribosyltransferase [Muribaculaceae bacterium]
MLRIAIQAKGRLNEKSMSLLSDAGISASGADSRKLLARAEGLPVDLLFLRDDDIPQAVAMGVADVGIVGLNEVSESGENVEVAMKLGFGGCRISIAVPKGEDYTGVEWCRNKRIATSYPVILRRFFDEKGVEADIHRIAGSVEIAPAVGMADAIFDIVSSGGTLIQNGLKEVEKVFFSEAVLITGKSLDDEKKEILEDLMFRFQSILSSRGMKYVLLNLPESALEEAVALLPGMKSPTVLPLAEKGWVSMHAVIAERELWTKIKALKQLGAEDILVVQLDNLIN